MKAAKNIFIAITLFSICEISVSAQTRRLSVGAEFALPAGSFADDFGIGFGGSIRYEVREDSKYSFMGTVGFLSMSAKESGGTTQTMIPIQIGGKYYFSEENGFYFAYEFGVHLITALAPEKTVNGVTTPSSSVSSTDLSFAPGIGYLMSNLEVGVKYQVVVASSNTYGYFAARIAYVLGGK